MTDADPTIETEDAPNKSTFGKGSFRRSAKPKIPADAARRQGDVTRLALSTLGSKEEAMAYLNLERAELGGRPLDLATSTAEGLKLVERDLVAISTSGTATRFAAG